MPITVTVSRGTPLPPFIALLFTVVGAGMVIAGFTVVGKIEVPGGTSGSDVILDVIAVLLVVPAWLFYARSLLRHAGDRRAAADDVPHELAEPPAADDPAVVAVVVSEGKPSGRAVAATVLGLADHEVIDIQETGDRVIIDIPSSAAGRSATDELVLHGLRERADESGHVVGPPVWPDKIDWWRDYTRDARRRAIGAGLLESRIPLIGLMLVTILTATALALIFFWYIVSFIGFILFANGVPHLIARASGYRLSASGVSYRAQWVAFGRYIRAHKSLRDVGPAGVAVWGPNLVYGVLVGEGDKAARALAPRVGHDEPAPDALQTEFTTEL
jgi:hypothetical protein